MNKSSFPAKSDGSLKKYFCVACGHQNIKDVNFCVNCGARQSKRCSACAHPIPSGSKFCNQCGTSVSGNGPSAPLRSTTSSPSSPNLRSKLPPALARKITAASVGRQGERRDVTVLFLDIANFTATTNLLDNELVYHFTNEALSLLLDVVHKYEGTIDKFTGDGLMALFGAPVAHEDDPARAVRAALEMQIALKPLQIQLKKEYGFDLKARIGINTGPAIAGKLGSNLHMEYTVIGETVNLAARLETAAQPDTILVSAETFQRTQPLFDFETVPAFEVKGFPEAIRAFRPIGWRDNPKSIRGLPGLQVPMIGRTAELTQLRTALADVRQGSDRIVLVTGEAGVGKSRLITEFRQSLDDPEVSVIQGGCQAYTSATPLWLVAEILRQMIGLVETDPREVQCEVVQAYLAERNLADNEIAPYLLLLLGCPQQDPELEARLQLLDATMLQKQTYAAIRQLMLVEIRRSPTVLILEDLHWIDPASRDFLAYFIQTTAGERMMLVLVSRQEERRDVLRTLIEAAGKESTKRLASLPLTALSKNEGLQLVDQLIPHETPEAQALKQEIVGRVDGNPFYIEELIRMLIDQGGLLRVGEKLQFTPAAPQLISAVPGTVKGLILARFDRLPQGLRQTLQNAAVLGNTFPARLLESLEEINPEAMAAHFRALEYRQFLVARPYRSEAGYIFRHALMQETIYDTLLKQDRRRIHGQAAAAIENDAGWHPDERDEALAYHYAKSNTPTEAIPYLIASADKAAHRGAYETAAEQYRRAIELIPDKPNGDSQHFFHVRLGLGTALKYTGKFSEASQVLSEGLNHLWKSSVSETTNALWQTLVKSLQQLADILQSEGKYDAALLYLEAGLQVLGTEGPREQPHLWQALVNEMAWIRFRQGQLEEAFHLARAAVGNTQEIHEVATTTLASLYNTLGNLSWHVGNLDQAITFMEKSLHLYESIGYTRGVAVAKGNLGILFYKKGYWLEATKRYQRAYDLHQNTGDLQNQACNLDNLGLLYMCQGKHKQSRQELEAALAIRQNLGDTWGIAQSHVNLATLSLTQKDWSETINHAKTGLDLANSIGSAEIQIEACWLLAITHTEVQETNTGLQLVRQALKMARENGLLEKEMECLHALGVIYNHTGNHVKAEQSLRQTIELAEAQNNPHRQGLAWLELARVAHHAWKQMEHSDRDTSYQNAMSAIKTAIDIFQALGAAHDLSQAQILLEQIQSES